MFEGSLVALVTPFRDGKLDEEGLSENVRFQIENGTQGLVPCGTTGESPTLTEDEQSRVIEVVVESAEGKVPVVAGTGTNSTAKTISNTRRAKELGVDGALVITPYYNKPTQEGLYSHFVAVTEAVDLPVILYNIPGRTGVNISSETLARLSQLKNITGVKEASGSLDRVSEILDLCGKRITVLSGDDSLTLPMMSVGAKGVISVIANIVPRDLSEMILAFQKGDISRARGIHQRLFPLSKAMFLETNPGPVKAAMNLLGMSAGEVRLPLVPLAESHLARLKEALRRYELL